MTKLGRTVGADRTVLRPYLGTRPAAVSYTHLDVYKRQALYRDPHDFPNATKLSEAGQQIIANMANLYQSVLADL